MAVCERCGQEHVAHVRGGHTVPACAGHVTKERADENGYRAPLDQPRPCRRPPRPGLNVCAMHGGRAPQTKAAAERREQERKMTEAARKLIPDLADRAKIVNPLETLLELASEANAFRESLRLKANELDSIRYAANGAAGEQVRAEVALYRQAIKDTTDLLVAIARLDIEKMLARVTLAQAEQALAGLRAGMEEAGLTDDQKRTVMTGAARHLRAVAS